MTLPEGIRVRAAGESDAAAVVDVLRADEVAVSGRSSIGVADLLDWWQRADLEHDSWLLEEDDRLLALGWVSRHGDVVEASGSVHPRANGRGLGGVLVELAERRALELGGSRVHQHAFAAAASARQLFEARGYREVRRFYMMAIELGAEAPPEPELAEGLMIETFRIEDAREWYEAAAEAFAEEWGFVSLPFDEWSELRFGGADFDPTLWFLVRDGGQIAALARCEAGRHGGGFVGMLGVRRPWRRRGLGLALLQHAFGEFHSRGERRVSLGVDSENPTGATRLYERAGMHVESEDVLFSKELGA